MNSPRRTAPGSHPDSDAAFPFSPGGAARRPFLFFHLPPSPHGAVRAASLSPSRGLRSRGFRGGRGGRRSLRQSFQRSLRRGCPRAFRPSGPPVARPSCRSRRPAAVLPAFPAGQPFFAACPPFSAACPPFSPARSPRFPAYLPLGLQSRVQAFDPLSWRLHAPEAAGASSVSLMARRGRFPVGPDRPSPAARSSLFPPFFAPYI